MYTWDVVYETNYLQLGLKKESRTVVAGGIYEALALANTIKPCDNSDVVSLRKLQRVYVNNSLKGA